MSDTPQDNDWLNQQVERAMGIDAESPDFLRSAPSPGELAHLKAELTAWEEREAAVCPEDVGFEEFIRALTRQRDAEKATREAAERERDEVLARVLDAVGIERTELALRWELPRGVEVQASGGPDDATRFIDLLTQARYVVDDLKRRESAAEGALARLRELETELRGRAVRECGHEAGHPHERCAWTRASAAYEAAASLLSALLPPSEGAPKSTLEGETK